MDGSQVKTVTPDINNLLKFEEWKKANSLRFFYEK